MLWGPGGTKLNFCCIQSTCTSLLISIFQKLSKYSGAGCTTGFQLGWDQGPLLLLMRGAYSAGPSYEQTVTGVLQLLTITFCLDGGSQDQGYGGWSWSDYRVTPDNRLWVLGLTQECAVIITTQRMRKLSSDSESEIGIWEGPLSADRYHPSCHQVNYEATVC